jgi:hypothetical protein
MDKDEMKELIRKGDCDHILQHDQLRVSKQALYLGFPLSFVHCFRGLARKSFK